MRELLIVHTDRAPSSLMAKHLKAELSSHLSPMGSIGEWHISWKLVEHQVKWEAEADQILVLSPHKSKENIPLLSLHVPGNPCEPWVSGKGFTLNMSDPIFSYRLFMAAYELVEEAKLGLDFSYEVDHHGPTINSPVVFYEIGSDESMWNREDLAEVLAKAVPLALRSEAKPESVFVGFGGGHYAPKFVKATVERGWAFSHILAKYAMDCTTDDVLKQAVEKSTVKVDGFALDWKGLRGPQRQRIKALAEELDLPIERL